MRVHVDVAVEVGAPANTIGNLWALFLDRVARFGFIRYSTGNPHLLITPHTTSSFDPRDLYIQIGLHRTTKDQLHRNKSQAQDKMPGDLDR